MIKTAVCRQARDLEADGAIAGPSNHQRQQDRDIDRSVATGDNALSESEDDSVQPENQLGAYPWGVQPWDDRLNDEQRAAGRFGLWFRQLMESDSGKKITVLQ